jgi:hypothetical protein
MQRISLTMMGLLAVAPVWADDFADEFADEFNDEFAQEASLEEESSLQYDFSLEIDQGVFTSNAGPMADNTWAKSNQRLKLRAQESLDKSALYAKLYLTNDTVSSETKADLREVRLQYSPTDSMDLSIGRQVSTWGVGDMLFINDLFPKDWKALFLGQDMEYLKAPADSLRMTNYFGDVTWDFVYTPEFTADITPTGCHLATYNPATRAVIANAASCGKDNLDLGKVSGNDGELATQLKFDVSGHQMAFYGYRGYYKNPRSMTQVNGQYMPFYPRLNAYGFSDEGQVGPGIFTFEYGYYDSAEDTATNLLVENSMHKALIGYKMDVSASLTLGMQAYVEHMTDHDQYQSLYQTAYGSAAGMRDEDQFTYTLRVMHKSMQDTLMINLMHYERPNDEDSFTTLDVTKQVTNRLSIIGGMNIFTGTSAKADREFALQKDSDNVYLRVKYAL